MRVVAPANTKIVFPIIWLDIKGFSFLFYSFNQQKSHNPKHQRSFNHTTYSLEELITSNITLLWGARQNRPTYAVCRAFFLRSSEQTWPREEQSNFEMKGNGCPNSIHTEDGLFSRLIPTMPIKSPRYYETLDRRNSERLSPST